VKIPCTQLKGENQKNLICKGGILKEFLKGGNAKHAHLAGGNDLLTHHFIMMRESEIKKKIKSQWTWRKK
jgi:hypothetical protein